MASVCIHRRDQANINGLYPLTRPNRKAHAKLDEQKIDGGELHYMACLTMTKPMARRSRWSFSPSRSKVWRSSGFLTSMKSEVIRRRGAHSNLPAFPLLDHLLLTKLDCRAFTPGSLTMLGTANGGSAEVRRCFFSSLTVLLGD